MQVKTTDAKVHRADHSRARRSRVVGDRLDLRPGSERALDLIYRAFLAALAAVLANAVDHQAVSADLKMML